jgi:hypothetical protein
MGPRERRGRGIHPVIVSIAGVSSNTAMLEVPGTILRSALTGIGRIAAPESLLSAYACSLCSRLANTSAICGIPSRPWEERLSA